MKCVLHKQPAARSALRLSLAVAVGAASFRLRCELIRSIEASLPAFGPRQIHTILSFRRFVCLPTESPQAPQATVVSLDSQQQDVQEQLRETIIPSLQPVSTPSLEALKLHNYFHRLRCLLWKRSSCTSTFTKIDAFFGSAEVAHTPLPTSTPSPEAFDL